MRPILVTLCTNRKRSPAARQLRARTLRRAGQKALLEQWVTRVAAADATLPASKLYAGRGFSEALRSVDHEAHRLWIVSAGLGLISGTYPVPPYDLTLSPRSPDAIQDRLAAGEFLSAAWWQGLNQQFPSRTTLSTLVRSHPGDFVVVTLSSTYLPLIIDDLVTLTPSELATVRLVGNISPQRLPPGLQAAAVTYDERFDGPGSPLPGTRSDFAQRAARHFITDVLGDLPDADSREHQFAVSRILQAIPAPARPRNQRLSDEQLEAIITRLWPRTHGHTGRTLRLQRDELRVACEQSRCAALVRDVRARLANSQ